MYRNLTENEIACLKAQGCCAENWGTVWVVENFVPDTIVHVSFSGKIYLGEFTASFMLPGGVKKKSGIRNAVLHNVTVGDQCCIEQVRDYIANYQIGQRTLILNVDRIVVDESTTFGNGLQVAVLNESGGREVCIHDALSAQEAYLQAFYGYRSAFLNALQQLIEDYCTQLKNNKGTIGTQVTLVNSGDIRNMRIGDGAKIIGATRLVEGSLNSNLEHPIQVGYQVNCENFILSAGSKIIDGSSLKNCFIGEASTIGRGFSATDSLFFSNCHAEQGEACAIFAGPFTVTHHKSTLLIGGMYSFMNAGSGTNQSNHGYRLGPVHQGVLDRGCKTASNAYLLWPAHVGAFSLIKGRFIKPFDTRIFPYSYLIEEQGVYSLVPGVNLRSVGTARDIRKWPIRDSRNLHKGLDQIDYDALSPFIIEQMVCGREALMQLAKEHPLEEYYRYGDFLIHNRALQKGIQYYTLAIDLYVGNVVMAHLASLEWTTTEELTMLLTADHSVSLYATTGWIDLAGTIISVADLELFFRACESGSFERLTAFDEQLKALKADYLSKQWLWVTANLQKWYTNGASSLSFIVQLLHQYKAATIELNELILSDAKKEFSPSFQISYGIDGGEADKEADFIYVHGTFEAHPFVRSLLEKQIATLNQVEKMLKKIES